jgi:hypothetical protein
MIIIKKCALVIAPCLTKIAYRCLTEGTFPEAWKNAQISPIPKKHGSSNPSDYRPISLLPLLSKFVENLIMKVLQPHIEPLLSDNQFGFRERRSTSDAILLLQHHVLRGFEKCEMNKQATRVIIVFFDIAKAFDVVPHKHLLQALHEVFDLPPYLLNFIRSYLTGRTLKVKVEGSLSSAAKVTSGQCNWPNTFYSLYQYTGKNELEFRL